MVLNLIQNSNVITQNKEVGRNNPCICGSGKKYKRCCLNRNKTLNTFYMGRNFTVEFSIYAIDDLVNLHLKELSIPLIKEENPSVKSSKKDKEDFIFSFLEQTFCETISQDQKIKMSVINYKNEMEIYSKLFKAVQLGYKQVIYEEDLKSIVTSMFKRLDVYKFLVANNNLTYKYKELAMVERSLI